MTAAQFARLRDVDWEDVASVEPATVPLLESLGSNPELLRGMLDEVRSNDDLLKLCEHYDVLDKVVLYNDAETGVRLRLHVFLPGYFDRAHNHRWTFSSLVLRGSYRHSIFRSSEGLSDAADPSALELVLLRTERANTPYTLHHSAVHSVVAEPFTISLVLRGPAVKNRLLNLDRETGKTWWSYGAQNESSEEIEKKRMTTERLDEVTAHLKKVGVI